MKTKKHGISVLTALLCLVTIMTVSGCGGGKSAFVGKWYLVEGEGRYIPKDIELLKDGTGFAFEQAVTWKTEKNRFFVTHPDVALAFNYVLSDSRIDFTNDDGETFVYMKLGGPSALVGEWEVISGLDNGEQRQIKEENKSVQVFTEDGTYTAYLASDPTHTFPSLKWAADKETLYVIGDRTTKMSYKIEGSTITRTSIDGEGIEHITEFKKK